MTVSGKMALERLAYVAVLALVMLVVSWPALAKDLYVNNSGSPACSDATTWANNSSGSPWCTIGRAAWGSTSYASPNPSQAAQAGDTVLIEHARGEEA